MSAAGLALVVRRVFAASPERLFRAWTSPGELLRWWGPAEVTPEQVEVDLRTGGAYRIGNRLDDGRLIWISGVFEAVEPPHRLIYSWQVAPGEGPASRVIVTFAAHADGAELVIVHERIADATVRADHERGWNGCLDGLARFIARA